MDAHWIYLLKANIAIAVFYGMYRWFYRNDTFLTLRRILLISIVALSLLYPVADLTPLFSQSRIITNAAEVYVNMLPEIELTAVSHTSQPIDWSTTLTAAYCIISALILARFLTQLLRILWLRITCVRIQMAHTTVWKLTGNDTPFSFLHWIFINPHNHSEAELEEILEHESTHVNQQHSLDVILGELFVALCWINPIAWRVRAEVRKNLEFLADRQVMARGFDAQAYQYHLLRLSSHSVRLPLANQINVSPLKERIMMMNKEQSPKIRLVTYTLLLPLAFLFLVANNAQALVKKFPSAMESIAGQTEEKTFDVSGIVKDNTDRPLPGVNIIIDGTSIGTVSDKDGNFKLSSCSKADRLVFSYIGMQTTTVTVDKATTNLGVTLADKPENLTEVKVVGSGNTPLMIRTGGKNPLIIADGKKISRSEMDKIDPNTIDQISVLKEKNATDIYGNEANEGVILITIKKKEDGGEKKRTAVGPDGEEMVFTVVEQMPSFPGGNATLLTYLQNTIQYPKEALDKAVSGRVICSFVVEADGSITRATVEQKVDPLLDAEAIRVIRNMPKWAPGKQRGKAVAVKFNLPIAFGQSKPTARNDDSETATEVSTGTENTKITVRSSHSITNIASSTPQDSSRILVIGSKQLSDPSKAPLVLLDGKEVSTSALDRNSPDGIDPRTIESVSVVKDGSLTSTYGAKAANGVVVVTSKKK